jgi:glycosyltransferase involved in cell wall biosynthesis
MKSVGYVDSSQIGDYYKMADVFLLPSYYEGMSISLLEALCCGVPILATDIEGNKEVLNDGLEFSLTRHNEKEFMDKLMHIVNDASLRERMRAEAVRLAISYRAEVVIPKYIDLYRNLLNRR